MKVFNIFNKFDNLSVKVKRMLIGSFMGVLFTQVAFDIWIAVEIKSFTIFFITVPYLLVSICLCYYLLTRVYIYEKVIG